MDDPDDAPVIDLQAYRAQAVPRPPAADALEASHQASMNAAIQATGQWVSIIADEDILQGADSTRGPGPLWLVVRWSRHQQQADLLAGPFQRDTALRYATTENWRLVHASDE